MSVHRRHRHSAKHHKQKARQAGLRGRARTYPTPAWKFERTPEDQGREAAAWSDELTYRLTGKGVTSNGRQEQRQHAAEGPRHRAQGPGRPDAGREAAEVRSDVGRQQGPEVAPRADSVDVITAVASRLLDGVRQQVNPK